MISKIRHTGIYVEKYYLENVKQFYIKLGFEIFHEGLENYPVFNDLEIVKLKTKNREVLELVGVNYPINQDGSHIALEVDNLDDVYNELKQDTYFMIEPMLSNDGTAKVAFCKDPNDYIVELVEIL